MEYFKEFNNFINESHENGYITFFQIEREGKSYKFIEKHQKKSKYTIINPELLGTEPLYGIVKIALHEDPATEDTYEEHMLTLFSDKDECIKMMLSLKQHSYDPSDDI